MVSVSQSVSCAQKEPKPNFKDGGRQMENHFKSIRLERSFKIKKVLTFLRISVTRKNRLAQSPINRQIWSHCFAYKYVFSF